MGRKRQDEIVLTERQREVLGLISRGYSNAEIAERLGISLAGAKWHVSELLVKFGVDSRDELPERWQPPRRVSQLGWLLGGLSGVKLAVGVGVAAVAVAAAGTGWLVAGGRRDAEGTPGDDALQVSATPTPAALNPLLPPRPPGAVLDPAEALQRAEALIQAESGGFFQPRALKTPFDISALHLVSATWHEAPDRIQSADPDFYWTQGDGSPRNVWHFEWRLDGVAIGPARTLVDATGELFVEAVLADEPLRPWTEILGYHASLREVEDGNHTDYSGGGFRSKRGDEMLRSMLRTGEDTHIAFLNNADSGPSLAVHPAVGGWCFAEYSSPGVGGTAGCGWPNPPVQPIHFSQGFDGDPRTNPFRAVTLVVTALESAAWFDVLVEGRAPVRYAAAVPPPELGLRARFGYLSVDADAFTVVAYDASGAEIGRQEGGTSR